MTLRAQLSAISKPNLGWMLALTCLFATPVLATNQSTTSANTAEKSVFAKGAAGSISALDIQVDADRIPENERDAILAEPDKVQRIANNLYMRRALAAQAQANGLAQQPKVQAAVQLVVDHILSEARLAQIAEQNTPNEGALEGFAKASYRAAPDSRFQKPAEIYASHILIDKDTPEAKVKAQQLLAQLQAGADFATLAKANSTDKATAEKGGDLGNTASMRLVSAFQDALDALQKSGEISPLVETQYGFHIIRLDKKILARKATFLEVREQLLGEAKNKAQQEARQKEIQKLEETVQWMPDAIDGFAKSYQTKPALEAMPATAVNPVPAKAQ